MRQRGSVTQSRKAAIEEADTISRELTPGYEILCPGQQSQPFVFCSPHSGRIYPRSFLRSSRLDALVLRKSEDCYVDRLFQHVCGQGAPLLSALFPRAYLDVNREAFELDPQLISGRLPHYANTRSFRVAGGLGTIARIVSEGEEIYRHSLPLSVAEERISRLYVPFHDQLSRLLDITTSTFGYAVLIDCHSMPSATVGRQPGPRPDFVLGDRFGETCDAGLTRFVQMTLEKMGYQVQLNRPYAGGYITETYGVPQNGTHALQIEINRALYLDERSLQPTKGFDQLQRDLSTLTLQMFKHIPQMLNPAAAAAE